MRVGKLTAGGKVTFKEYYYNDNYVGVWPGHTFTNARHISPQDVTVLIGDTNLKLLGMSVFLPPASVYTGRFYMLIIIGLSSGKIRSWDNDPSNGSILKGGQRQLVIERQMTQASLWHSDGVNWNLIVWGPGG